MAKDATQELNSRQGNRTGPGGFVGCREGLGAFNHFRRIVAIGALAFVALAADAATPGLPLAEPFDDIDLRDGPLTTADWSEMDSELLLPAAARIYGAFPVDPNDPMASLDVGSVADRTTSIALGDIDGDGDLDLVVGNNGEPNLLYLNDGTANPFGSIPAANISLQANQTEDIALGDFDRDGDLDVVAANTGGESSRLYLNNGTDEPFAGVAGIDLAYVGNHSVGIVAGDLDGDGDMDLIFGNDKGEINRYLLNNGTANPFAGEASVVITQSANSTKAVELADVDNDGDLDLVVGNTGALNFLHLNNGSATPFIGSMGIVIGTVVTDTTSIRAVDVNGDGLVDVITGEFSNANQFYLNNGTTSRFSDPGGNIGVELDSTFEIAVGDFDNDGDYDAVSANALPQRARFSQNFGTTGLFTPSTGTSLASEISNDIFDARAIELGDIDRDGDLDVVIGNFGAVNRFHPNTANLNPFNGASSDTLDNPDVSDSRDVKIADVNGDGYDDIIVANTTHNILVNGDFEKGDLSGWLNVPSVSGGKFFINNGGFDPPLPSPDGPMAAISGANSALASQPPPFGLTAEHRLVQTVAIPSTATIATLSWVHQVRSHAALGPTQFYRVEVLSLTGGPGTITVYTTATGDPALQGLTQFNVNVSAFIGQTVELTFRVHPEISAFNVHLDNVRLDIGNESQVHLNNSGLLGGGGGGGGGLFADGLSIPATAVALALGDVDKDGDLDLAVARSLTNTSQVLFNDGNGVFSGAINLEVFPVGSDSLSIAMGDIDSDGDVDVVVGHDGRNRISLNQFQETGGVRTMTDTNVFDVTIDSDTTSAILLEDVDGDGDLDVIAGNGDVMGVGQRNRLYLNNGTANPFAGIAGTDITTDADATVSLVLGDVDRDGDLDLIAGNVNGANKLYLNDGTTSPFATTGVGIPIGAVPVEVLDTRDVMLVDIDRDGDLDFFTANHGAGIKNYFYLSDGSSSPFANSIAREIHPSGLLPNTVAQAAGDFDGDGDPDLVMVNGYLNLEENLFILNSDTPTLFGNNAITQTATLDSHLTVDVVTGDLDGDGDIDAIVGNFGQPNRLYLNDGSSAPFENVTGSDITADAHQTKTLELVDIDSDGDLDLIEGNQDELNRIYLNNGTADPFNGVTAIDIGVDMGATVGLAVGDYDCDGALDLVVANSDGLVLLYLNNGSGDPFAAVNGGVMFDFTVFGLTPSDVAMGDITGDVFPDVVVGVRDSVNLVLENSGIGSVATSLTLGVDFSGGDNTTAIELADLNSDGTLDVVEAVSGGPNQIWLNTGMGGATTFGESPYFNRFGGDDLGFDISETQAIAVHDVNLDGALDILTANGTAFNPEPNLLYLSGGAALGGGGGGGGGGGAANPFANSAGMAYAPDLLASSGIAVQDMTGDGLPDVFEGNGDAAAPGVNRLFSRKSFNVRPAIANSLRVDTEASNITAAKLTPTENVPPNTFVDYFLSNNGGARYYQIIEGQQFVFPTAGTDLRWRAELRSLAPQTTPIVDQIDITGPAANAAPVLTDINVIVVEDLFRDFTVADFLSAYSDGDNDSIQFIRVSSLPTVGDLTLDGVAVGPGQAVPFGDVEKLKYRPNAQFNGVDSFVWNAFDGTAFAIANRNVNITVAPVADTPAVVDSSTDEDVQTFSGLRISRAAGDNLEVTHFKITNIRNGVLYQNDGTTPIADGQFITVLQGDVGLRFTPDSNVFATGLFNIQASVSADDSGLGGGVIQAEIAVTAKADTPSVSNAFVLEDTQTTTGLVIARHPSDGVEVAYFKITGIQGGALFEDDGVTPIVEGSFITAAKGIAGLRFTPTADSIVNGQFVVEASLTNLDSGIGGMSATALITVLAVPDEPAITGAATLEDTQTISGLVVSRNMADNAEVSHFKIAGISGGTVFKNDGVTPLNEGNFATFAEGIAGLKFTPSENSEVNGSFNIRGATAANNSSLGGPTVTATIVVTPVNDPPVANPDTYALNQGGMLDSVANNQLDPVLRNDTDVENDPLTAILVSGPTHGTIVGFGDDSFGQASGPVGLTDLKAIAAGDFFTAALRTDGTVVAFGEDGLGESTVPPGLAGVVAISAGGNHTLALKSDGAVAAFGSNADGQLNIPMGLVGVTAVAGGGGQSYALKADGTVQEWGGGVAPPMGLTDVASITAGQDHALALKTDGTVVAWGGNADGQATPPMGLANVRAVAAGTSFSLALKDDGTVVGWGRNNQNQIDIPAGLNDAVAISAGQFHALALKADGTVVGWGTDPSNPATPPAGLSNVSAIAAGGTHSVVLKAYGTLTLNPDGSFAYAHDGAESSVDEFVYKTNDGMEDGNTTIVTIQIGAINGPPLVTVPAAQTVNEDEQLIISGTTVSDPDAGTSHLVVNLSVLHGTIGLTSSAGLNLVDGDGSDGRLTFTGSQTDITTALQNSISYQGLQNYNGPDTLTVDVNDQGNTGLGSVLSDSKTVGITINPINDEPSISATAPPQAFEDVGAVTSLNWATFVPGPVDENGQDVVAYTVSNLSDPLAFLIPPAVSNAGDLTYTPAADFFGAITFDLSVQDDGMTADGGDDVSQLFTYTITVNAVNDRPTFGAMTPLTAVEDTGLQTELGWVTTFSPGPVNEVGQAPLFYTVTSLEKPELFTVLPAISVAGDLTYTLAADAFGTSLIEFTVTDNGGIGNNGINTSLPQPFTITVTGVNDKPSIAAVNPPPSLEDDGLQTVVSWATMLPGATNEVGDTAVEYLVTSPFGIFETGPDVLLNGDLVYKVMPNLNDSQTAFTFDVSVRDSGGMGNGGVDLSDIQSFTISVTPVNDPPTFTGLVLDAMPFEEDQASVNIPNWVTASDAGPSDAPQNFVEYVVSNVQQNFFADGPAVDLSGTLSFTLADDVFGAATFDVQLRDDGGVDDGGVDLSEVQTVTINVSGLNDAPSFTAMDPPAVFEDSGETSVENWATFSPGGVNETDDVLTYIIGTVEKPQLFADGPTVTVAGELKYTPAPDVVGTSTFEVSVQDEGGSGGGNFDTSTVSVFTITIDGVNDPPDFAVPGVVSAPEDGGPQTFPNYANNFVPGPADENGQMIIGFTVSNVSNPGLFLEGPAIAPDGDLTFTANANMFGFVDFDIVAQDDGGVANSGDDQSPVHRVRIDVFAVNDEPSFVAVNPPEAIEDAGPQTVSSWATFDPGAADEIGQAAMEYFVTVASNPGLFAAGGEPAVSPAGDLTYTLALNANGNAEIDVSVRDNGGVGVVGDDDTSQVQRFTISARAVNDAPSIVAFDPPASLEDQGEQTVPAWVQMFISGPVDENGQNAIAYTVGGIGDPTLFAMEPAIDLNGTLTYTPAANASGSSTFTVTVQDDGQTADNGADTSVAQTFVITVTGVNDRPGFTASNPPAVMEDAGLQTISGWALFDAGPNESMQQVAQYIISPPTDALLFSAGPSISVNGDLTYTPASHAHGAFNFTVAVQDNGGVADNGVDTSDPPQAFSIVINSVNDTPFVGVPGPVSLDEDGSISIAGLAVLDADANQDPLLVSLSVSSGALGFENSAGVTVTDADGSDGSLAFTGGQNAAIVVLQAGVTYTPNSNFNGEDALVIQADDQGSSGPDGAKTGMGVVMITVNPIADTPTVVDATTDEDVQTASGLTIARGAGDGAETSHMKITGISGGALYKNDGVTSIANGEFIPASDGADGLRFTPAENLTANGAFTVQASSVANDSGLGGMTVTATITVNSVNDAPVFALPAPATAPEDGSTLISGIEVSDADAGASPILMTVSVGHGSLSLTSSTGINFTPPDGDDGAAGTLSFSGTQTAITDAFKNSIFYTPTPDYDGPDTLTLSANDQGQSGGDSETTVAMLGITVVGDNDQPTTVGIPDFVVTLNSMNSVINLAASFDDVEDADPTLAFSILSNTNPGLFDSVVIDAVAGTLTLDYAADKPGSSFVTLRCADTGGLTVDATFRVSVIDIQESKIVASDAASVDWFGWSVAISGDWLVVGAYRDDDAGEGSGAAYVYQRQAGAEDRWIEVQKLTVGDAAEGDEIGRSVAIAGDTIVVGANGDDDRGDRSGSGYVFQRDQGGADQWGQVAKINSNTGAAGDRFGWSVAIHANSIVVGAPRDDDNGSDSGAAFVFERDAGGPNKWGQTHGLLPGDSGGVNYWFGNSVAIEGDDTIIGQPFDQASGADSGSAFVFGRNSGGADQWGQAAKLISNDAAADDWFGWSVSINGGTAAIGAARDDVDGKADAGSAYVFQRDQGGADQWGQVRKLISTDIDTGDSFGFSVSVSGDAVVVGAHNDNDKGDDSGSAYLFGRNQGGMDQWMQSSKLTGADGEAGDVFGYSVAIDGDSFAVGAPNSDDAGSDSGSTHLFRIGSTLDLFRSVNFSATDLADPTKEATVWGDAADPDMDGQSNFFEFVAGLDPTAQASKFEFRIEAVQGQPAQRRLIFSPIVAGRTYYVEVNTNLGQGPFVPLAGATVENNGVVRTVTDVNATGFRTYRVRLSIP
jgi:VCBS repeat-containing protein